LLAAIEHFIKRRIDPIRLIGGGAQSDLWCQIHADVMDREIQQMQDPILANVRGAIFLGAVGMGYMAFEDIPERTPVAKTYQPNPDNRAIYDEMYAAFLGFHDKTKSLYASLNKQAAIETAEEQS
jgi:xylulokinase